MQTVASILRHYPAAADALRARRCSLMDVLDKKLGPSGPTINGDPSEPPAGSHSAPFRLWDMHAIFETGLLPPQLLPAMGSIEIAPGWVVEASRLRWHPLLREIVELHLDPSGQPLQPDWSLIAVDDDRPPGSDYVDRGEPNPYAARSLPSPEGAYIRLIPIVRLLTENVSATGWRVDKHERSAERFSIELSAMIRVVHVNTLRNVVYADERDYHTLREPHWIMMRQDGPGDRFAVFAESVGRSGTVPRFVNIDDARYTPQFRTLSQAMRLADRAILAEPILPRDWTPNTGGAPGSPPRYRWHPASP